MYLGAYIICLHNFPTGRKVSKGMGRLRPKDLGRFHNLAWVSLLQAQRRQSELENASLLLETKLWGDWKQQRAWETLEEDPPTYVADKTRWATLVSWAVREQAVQWCDLERDRRVLCVCVCVCVCVCEMFGFFWVMFSFYKNQCQTLFFLGLQNHCRWWQQPWN